MVFVFGFCTCLFCIVGKGNAGDDNVGLYAEQWYVWGGGRVWRWGRRATSGGGAAERVGGARPPATGEHRLHTQSTLSEVMEKFLEVNDYGGADK